MLRGVNQVAFLDEGEVASGLPYWVMEFLEGEDLAARLDRLVAQAPVAEELRSGHSPPILPSSPADGAGRPPRTERGGKMDGR